MRKRTCTAMPIAPARHSARSAGVASTRGSTRLVCIAPAEDDEYRPPDDFQVEREGPVAQVVEVVLDAPLHLVHAVGLAAETVHLRPPGDAGTDLVADHVALDELAVELVVRDGVRAWADHAHAALQHVDELRQVVERGAAQGCPEGGYARVVAPRLLDDLALFPASNPAALLNPGIRPAGRPGRGGRCPRCPRASRWPDRRSGRRP